MDNIGNNGNIAISAFPYICNFLLYSNGTVLVNPHFDTTDSKSIIFQD